MLQQVTVPHEQRGTPHPVKKRTMPISSPDPYKRKSMTSCLARSLFVLVPSSRTFCKVTVCFVCWSEVFLFLETLFVTSSSGCLQEVLEFLEFEEQRSQNASFSCLWGRLRLDPLTSRRGALGFAAYRPPTGAQFIHLALRLAGDISMVYRYIGFTDRPMYLYSLCPTSKVD